jgi:hypothetical protein
MQLPCSAQASRLKSCICAYAAAYDCDHVEPMLLPGKEPFSMDRRTGRIAG